MLVMSRRTDQKIVFPGLGVTVTLLAVRGNTARIGIEAPRDISILREEIAGATVDKLAVQTDRHNIRNVMNSVNLFVMLYQKQMAANQIDDAASTFMKMVEYLEKQTNQGAIDFSVEQEVSNTLRGHVMIVEDDPDQLDLLSSLLSLEGLDVTAHQNGQSALNEMQSGCNPEIVLLDWNMPEFGGQWLVPKIRREFGEQSPKLFVVTGAEKPQTTDSDGVDAWIAKPLNQCALLARIRAVCTAAC